ncbi:hypothetical protein E3N88_35975 [Mikania micrantha]|uniref:Reverse transcriptase Ty1/copia-type domain-containing protein n=1 Tax=Mikania micrantha TaxID=192012 RepID=A0A5N6M2G0_9ASTR|nr:hypothetical protein E3N88_35975 [Mikania micrantha]
MFEPEGANRPGLTDPTSPQSPINTTPRNTTLPDPSSVNDHEEGSDESCEEIQTQMLTEEDTYDDTPPQGWKSLADVYDEASFQNEIYNLLLTEGKPLNFKEATRNIEWEEAMQSGIASIERNRTWELTDLPPGHRPIGLKWVFKIKRDASGTITKHKARLVAKGYIQQHSVDFDEVFTPVARLETVRLILALTAQRGWEVHHLDVKSAFLHGEFKEAVFVSQPEGFIVKGKERKVYKVAKALYDLKQAPRAWNTKLDGVLKEYGFQKCKLEQAVYTKQTREGSLVIGIYVDDLIVTGNNMEKILQFKKQMEQNERLGPTFILPWYGSKTKQRWNKSETNKLCYKGVEASKHNSGLPQLLTHTRPDLSYAVRYVSGYMQAPRAAHQQAVKQILRYVKGSTEMGIHYQHNGDNKLIGFSDSSYLVDMDYGKGTTGLVVFFNDAPVAWNSQKQPTVALSSCEAEFMAATSAACQAIWLKGLLAE